MLESLREERFTEAVEMTESVKLINDAIAKVAEAESILTTAAALVNAPHDDRILAFVMDLENLEIDLKRQTERME